MIPLSWVLRLVESDVGPAPWKTAACAVVGTLPVLQFVPVLKSVPGPDQTVWARAGAPPVPKANKDAGTSIGAARRRGCAAISAVEARSVAFNPNLTAKVLSPNHQIITAG